MIIRKLAIFVAAAASLSAAAQDPQQPDIRYDGRHQITDTITDTRVVVQEQTRVITNNFWSNWFALATIGTNAYWADCTRGDLGTRLTPQFNIGGGKWFTPGFGIKLQYTGFTSRANKYVQGLFTRGSKEYTDKHGKTYWKEKVKWMDLSLNLMFNITRMITGYEGYDSPKNANQFIASVGIGGTHHYDLPYGSANEWSGHVELQYSRFFTPAKAVSLDVVARGLFYETKFDGVYHHQTFDKNISLNVGVTYYFRERGWGRSVTATSYYLEDQAHVNYLNDQINELRRKQADMKPDTVFVASAPATEQHADMVRVSDLITFPYLVNFVIDKVEVVNRERVNLGILARMIKATPRQRYYVCGFADKHTGTVQRNIWLAENRAKNVFKVLTEEFGVPASQLVLDDKGGVENMFYDDPQLSRSVIISPYDEK